MRIRFATHADVPACVETGRRFHAMTRFRDYDYAAERLAERLRLVVDNPKGTHCFFLAEDSQGQPAGGLIGCVEQHFFSECRVASVIFYGVLPEKRMSGAGYRLLVAFRKWAENRGVGELNVGVNSGTDLAKMDRMFRRLGFGLVGGNYSLPFASGGLRQPHLGAKGADR